MKLSDFNAIIAGSVFLGMFGLICFGISGFIIATLKQCAGVNLFFDYNGVPAGILTLTAILIMILLYFISRE